MFSVVQSLDHFYQILKILYDSMLRAVMLYDSKNSAISRIDEKEAGIKFERVSAPQPDDIARAVGMEAAEKITQVCDSVVPAFLAAAKELLKTSGLSAELLLAKSLAKTATLAQQESGLATSPTRHRAAAHQVIYELRVYSLRKESFGSVLVSRAIRAAHCLTSIQFAPTSEHILLAYGRRHGSLLKSIVSDGEATSHFFTMLEIYRVSCIKFSPEPAHLGGNYGDRHKKKRRKFCILSGLLLLWRKKSDLTNMGDLQEENSKQDEKSKERTYFPWSGIETKTLLGLLVDGVNQNWRDASGSFNRHIVEQRILPALNKSCRCSKTYKQYQNRMKILKARYKGFADLLRHSSGFGWDPVTKKFTAEEGVWEDYLKGRPRDKHLRDDSFEDYEDLNTIFGQSIATGKHAIGLGDSTDARTYGIRDNDWEGQDIYTHDQLDEDEDGVTELIPQQVLDRKSNEKLPARKKARIEVEKIAEEINAVAEMNNQMISMIQ